MTNAMPSPAPAAAGESTVNTKFTEKPSAYHCPPQKQLPSEYRFACDSAMGGWPGAARKPPRASPLQIQFDTVADGDGVLVLVGVRDAVGVCDPVDVGVPVAVDVGVPVLLGEGVFEAVDVGVEELDAVALGLPVFVPVELRLACCVDDGLGVTLGELDGEPVLDAVSDDVPV